MTPPRVLWVDSVVHARECARFDAGVVRGPTTADCDIWVKAIGKDGYGRFSITRNGESLCVRPHRYALARALGRPLGADVFGLHECDNPLCVKIAAPGAHRLHVIAGTQRDNMIRMGRAGRGGGRSALRRDHLDDRQARSLALRDAARNGWDRAAITHVLQRGCEPGLFDLAGAEWLPAL
jgi:hypothetical protein